MRILAAAAVLGCSLAVGACASTTSRPSAFPNARPVERAPAPESAAPDGRAPGPATAAVTTSGAAVNGPAAVNSAASVNSPASVFSVIQTALDLRGIPYRLGGATPETGFDCSGFVSYVFRQHAIALPRTAAEQFGAGRAIGRDELAVGDLVFFSTIGPGATHVGLVITGGPQPEFVHAPADGSTVRVDRLDTDYWQRRWIGARRVL